MSTKYIQALVFRAVEILNWHYGKGEIVRLDFSPSGCQFTRSIRYGGMHGAITKQRRLCRVYLKGEHQVTVKALGRQITLGLNDLTSLGMPVHTHKTVSIPINPSVKP